MNSTRTRIRGLGASLLRGIVLFSVAGMGLMIWVAAGRAQMSIGSLTGILPPTMPNRSLLLGDDLAAFQSAWANPLNAEQTGYRNSVSSRANQATSGSMPTVFGTAANDASIAQAAGLRYAMTGTAADLNKAVNALLVSNVPIVGIFANPNEFIIRPEVVTSYLSAYDYIRGAPTSALNDATRAQIEARLDSMAGSLDYGNGTLSNARAKIGGTEAFAGVLLRDQALLDRGLSDLNANLGYSTTDDGFYTDSQAQYLNYTLRHIGVFLRAYEQGSGVNLYSTFQPLFDMSINLRKPDGTVPNISDGLNLPVAMGLFTQTPDAQKASEMLWYLANTTPSPYPWQNLTNITNNDGSLSTEFALTDFTGPVAAQPDRSPTFLATGQSHFSVFRQDWGATSDYLLLSPGVDSPALEFDLPGDPPVHFVFPAFHSAADTGEILLAAKGHYLLVAPGYVRTDLSNSPPDFTVDRPDWHNVLLVDGGVGTMDQGKAMRPEDFVHTNRLDTWEDGGYKGVSDFATLKMNYAATDVSRSIAFPGEDYMVVADRLHSATNHDYGFNLVGRGTRTVLDQQPGMLEVKWEDAGTQVIEHLFSTKPMTLTTASVWMHNTFNVYEQTQRMTATVNAADAGFLSILETGTAGSASHLAITNFSTSSLTGLRVEETGGQFTDWILSQATSALQTIDQMTSDGQYSYLRHVGGLIDGLMVADGTTLVDAGQTVFTATAPLTMSLKFEHGSILGTVSADEFASGTVLRLFGISRLDYATLDGHPLLVTPAGNGQYDLALTGGGHLMVSLPEPSTWLLGLVGATAMAFVARRRKKA